MVVTRLDPTDAYDPAKDTSGYGSGYGYGYGSGSGSGSGYGDGDGSGYGYGYGYGSGSGKSLPPDPLTFHGDHNDPPTP